MTDKDIIKGMRLEHDRLIVEGQWVEDENARLQARVEGLERLLNVVLPRCTCGDLIHCVSCGHRAKVELRAAIEDERHPDGD